MYPIEIEKEMLYTETAIKEKENKMTYYYEMLSLMGSVAVQGILKALISLVIGILAIRIAMSLVKKALEKSKLEKAAHTLILNILNVTLYVLLFLSVAPALGIDVTGVVAMASVLTLAVSLALQNMLANVIGGFTVLTTHPFRSGDYVEIGAMAGTVKEITMTYTILVTPDNKIVSMPNSSVVAAQITNYSASGSRRVDIDVSASYDAPTQKVIDALIQAGTVEKALTDPAPFAALTSYGESAINYTLRVWVNSADYWDVFFQVNQRVSQSFAENGIEMTYPHVNVHMK